MVFRSSETVRQWDGLIVWREIEEKRHPQEFVKGVKDDYAVRNPRPRGDQITLLSSIASAVSGAVGGLDNLEERDGDNITERDGDTVNLRGTAITPVDDPFQYSLIETNDGSCLTADDGNALSLGELNSIGTRYESSGQTSDNLIILEVDLGDEKEINFINMKMEFDTGTAGELDILFTNDYCSFTTLDSIVRDTILRKLQNNEDVWFPVSADARHVILGFFPDVNVNGPFETDYVLSKFDIYGDA